MNRRSLLIGASLATILMTTTAYAQTALTMWYHGAGNEVESKITHQIFDEFNASQSDWKVTI
jgi:multiple sugar transport system substrate-binding protein